MECVFKNSIGLQCKDFQYTTRIQHSTAHVRIKCFNITVNNVFHDNELLNSIIIDKRFVSHCVKDDNNDVVEIHYEIRHWCDIFAQKRGKRQQ